MIPSVFYLKSSLTEIHIPWEPDQAFLSIRTLFYYLFPTKLYRDRRVFTPVLVTLVDQRPKIEIETGKREQKILFLYVAALRLDCEQSLVCSRIVETNAYVELSKQRKMQVANFGGVG